MKKFKLTIIFLLFSAILIIHQPALLANGLSSAKSVAMGGAYIGLASGVDASKYNPANLGFYSHQNNGLELIGFGASITNNSFSLDDYNKYTGSLLTSEDKQYLLDRIPTEGLTVVADIRASALSLALGSFVISTEVIGLADVNLNKDIIDLILNGNAYADTVEITGSYSEAVAYGAIGFSYGRPIYSNGTRQIAVGTTIKFIRGIATEEVVELNGLASTYANGFEGEGNIIARTATGGSGYTIDLGAALKLNDSYNVGLSISNVVSNISWNIETEEHGYIFSFDSMTIDNSDQDIVVSNDYTIPTNSFESTLPSTLTIGVAKLQGKFLWTIDWQQGFRQAAGSSSEPRLSFGLEWSPLKAIPLRAGFASGGNKNTSFSFGSGLNLSAFYFDFAMISGASMSPYSTKGLNFAISTGINF